MQPSLRATPQSLNGKLKPLGLDEWYVLVAVEIRALGWIVRVDVPHKLALHSTSAFFLTDTMVRLEVRSSTLFVPLLQGRTFLEVFQNFFIEKAFGNGA